MATMVSIEEVVRRIVHEQVRAALQKWQAPGAPEIARSGLLTVAEAAVLLGVAEGTVPDWRTDRTGPPAVKLGRAVPYRREDIDQWIADQRK